MVEASPPLDHRNMPDLPPPPATLGTGGKKPAYGFALNGKFWLWRYTVTLRSKDEKLVDHSSHDLREALADGTSEAGRAMLTNVGGTLMVNLDRQSFQFQDMVSYARELSQIDPQHARSL